MATPTHIAFIDESNPNVGRFRSLSVVSVPYRERDGIAQTLAAALADSGISRELKWNRVKSAREGFAAHKVIDHVMDWTHGGQMRVDTLTWDTLDSRHSVIGRDDQANYERMYYWLLVVALGRRWGSNTVWHIHPDEAHADWETLASCLHYGDRKRLRKQPVQMGMLGDGWNMGFTPMLVETRASHDEPLIQVADFFAGMSSWAATNYDLYQRSAVALGGQGCLFDEMASVLSNSERCRCGVLSHLLGRCREHKYPVSLNTERHLKTMKSTCGLNFWPWTPQGEYDKAPTREDSRSEQNGWRSGAG